MLTSSVLALAVARRTVPVIGWRPRQNNCCTDVAGRAFLDALSILGLAAPGRMLSARFRSERWLQSLGGLKRMDRRSWLLSSGTLSHRPPVRVRAVLSTWESVKTIRGVGELRGKIFLERNVIRSQAAVEQEEVATGQIWRVPPSLGSG